MSGLLYFLAVFGESVLSVFGIRGTYEQPAYRVVQVLEPGIEIRAYGPRVAVETPVADGGESAAFERLFRYIAGANTAGRDVAMTAPVEQAPRRVAMTVPVELSGGAGAMRFFLPASLASDPPVPTEPEVRIVRLPAVTLGVVRFSGVAGASVRERQVARLRGALARAGRATAGEPTLFSYDPPFALPFVRRNEVALAVR